MTEVFTLATYNIMAPVPVPVRFNGQMERMARVAPALERYQASPGGVRLDAVVFQESIVAAQHAVLRKGMREAGFEYETPPLLASVGDGQLANGGVVVFSRHPITEHRVAPFAGCGCEGADCLCAKGCVYARINVLGRTYHVVSVHMQAWNTDEAFGIRVRQAEFAGKFIDSIDAGEGEPLVFAGDLNVDLYTQRPHLRALLDLIGVERLPLRRSASATFSSDPSTNALMGNDEGAAYASAEFPHGCHKEYLNSGRCLCCPRELLDHAGYVATRGAQPDLRRSWSAVVPLKAEQPFMVHLTASVRREIRDLSDHYPLVASYHYPRAAVRHSAEPVEAPEPVEGPPRSRAWVYWAMLAAVLLCGFMLLAAVAMRGRAAAPPPEAPPA